MPVDQVDQVKQKTDIVALISDHIDLKKAGRNYRALCPFHGEKTPSFMVSPELQIFKCFGCGESGDAISFLQKYEGMDFSESLKFLADRAGIKLKPTRMKDGGEKQRLYELNSFTSRFYHYILLKHAAGKAALDYLTKKRLIKPKTIEAFQLGYSPEVPGAITKFLIEKKRFSRQELEKSGLIYQRNGRIFDRFRGRLIFPTHDHRGNVVGFSGRILPDKEDKNLAKYVNTPETSIFHKGNLLYALNLNRGVIKKKKEAVVVEGQLDAISAWQAGIKNVVTVGGTALTEDQTRLIRRFAQRIILALDTDLAGDTAARRGIEIAEKVGLEVRVARLGKYQDPDEMIRKDLAGFKKAIRGAVGVWDFILGSIFAKHDLKTGPGKARISREVIPVLSSITDDIVQAHYVEKVAKKLGVPTAAVIGQITKSESPKKKDEVVVIKPKDVKGRRELLEERMMSLAFLFDPKILLSRKVSGLIKSTLTKKILLRFKQYSKGKRKFNPAAFAEALPNELMDGFANMILNDSSQPKSSLSAQKKELELIKYELAVLNIKDQLEIVTNDIQKYESKNNMQKLKKAEQKFSKLTKNLTDLEEIEPRGIIL